MSYLAAFFATIKPAAPVAGPPSIPYDLSMRQSRPMTFPDMGSIVGTTSYTFEFWGDYNGHTSQAFYLTNDNTANRFLAHLPYSGYLYFDSGNIDGAGRHYAIMPPGFTSGNGLHHFAFQVDAENNKMNVYYDGILYTSANHHMLRYPEAYPLVFPQTQVSAGEIRYWNYVRTPAQIQETLNVSLEGPQPGLVASWRCDERYGSTIRDRSGNNYHGTSPYVEPPAQARYFEEEYEEDFE